MLKYYQNGMTRHSDTIHDDVDLILMSHVPPGFMCITYLIDPLERDMCHPGLGHVFPLTHLCVILWYVPA
jgi:hypothetical protein